MLSALKMESDAEAEIVLGVVVADVVPIRQGGADGEAFRQGYREADARTKIASRVERIDSHTHFSPRVGAQFTLSEIPLDGSVYWQHLVLIADAASHKQKLVKLHSVGCRQRKACALTRYISVYAE